MRINDIATGSLELVGFFDIYPSSNTANFNGAWSTYPYFPSGAVVVSCIEQGLYVVEVIPPPRLKAAATAPTPAPTQPTPAVKKTTPSKSKQPPANHRRRRYV